MSSRNSPPSLSADSSLSLGDSDFVPESPPNSPASPIASPDAPTPEVLARRRVNFFAARAARAGQARRAAIAASLEEEDDDDDDDDEEEENEESDGLPPVNIGPRSAYRQRHGTLRPSRRSHRTERSPSPRPRHRRRLTTPTALSNVRVTRSALRGEFEHCGTSPPPRSNRPSPPLASSSSSSSSSASLPRPGSIYRTPAQPERVVHPLTPPSPPPHPNGLSPATPVSPVRSPRRPFSDPPQLRRHNAWTPTLSPRVSISEMSYLTDTTARSHEITGRALRAMQAPGFHVRQPVKYSHVVAAWDIFWAANMHKWILLTDFDELDVVRQTCNTIVERIKAPVFAQKSRATREASVSTVLGFLETVQRRIANSKFD